MIHSWRPQKDEPLSLDDMAKAIAQVCANYNAKFVYSDQHAAIPIAETLRKKYKLSLIRKPWTGGSGEFSKTSQFNAVRESLGTITLPNDAELIHELKTIVSKPLANGGMQISGSGKNDDRAHCAVMVLFEALRNKPSVATKTQYWYERQEKEHGLLRAAIQVSGY